MKENVLFELRFVRYLAFIFLFPIFLLCLATFVNFFVQPFSSACFVVLLFMTFFLLGSQILFDKIMAPYIEKLDEVGVRGLFDYFLKTRQNLQGFTEEQSIQFVCQVILHKNQTFWKTIVHYFPLLFALWLSLNWPQERGLFFLALNWVLFSMLSWPFYLEREDIFEKLKDELSQKTTPHLPDRSEL